jgi:hypothetical protein
VPVPKPTGWIRADLKPVSPPALADGVLVLYAQAGGGLAVVALDPQTGRTLWQDSASPGMITPGVASFLGTAGSTVVFLRPVNNSTGTAQVVGVAAATGRPRWHSPTGRFEDWPYLCPDNPGDICTTGSPGDAQQARALRYRASDGAPAGAAVISQILEGRSVGSDLYQLPGRPETLTAVAGGSVAWTRPLASVFTSPGLSTDYGWDFDRVPAAGLFVGSVGGPPLRSTATSATISLSAPMTAGFRISDGAAVWREAGTLYACGQPLPCPGAPAGALLGYRPPTIGVRLRSTGTASATQSSPLVTLSPDASTMVEGFSLATGKTLWSYDAGRDEQLFNEAVPLLGPYVVALPGPGGSTVALNLATGAHRPVPAGAVAWCQAIAVYTTLVPYPTVRGADYKRISGGLTKPCQPSGAAAAVPKTVPGYAGTDVDGLTVWSEPSEVVAAPTSS